jgi:hypothetical protein
MAILIIRDGSNIVDVDNHFVCRRCSHRFLHVARGALKCPRQYIVLMLAK